MSRAAHERFLIFCRFAVCAVDGVLFSGFKRHFITFHPFGHRHGEGLAGPPERHGVARRCPSDRWSGLEGLRDRGRGCESSSKPRPGAGVVSQHHGSVPCGDSHPSIFQTLPDRPDATGLHGTFVPSRKRCSFWADKLAKSSPCGLSQVHGCAAW